MKKTIPIMMLLLSLPVCAARAYTIGQDIGDVLNTDIVAYINNYAVPSFAANGTSVIVAEDLRNFGFDVVWDGSARTLNITRNSNTQVNETEFEKSGAPGSKAADMLFTDIKVFADGVQLPSYAINGYTMIPMESLTMYGEVNWVSEQRALKMWVDGLHIRSEMQKVEKYKAPHHFTEGTWSAFVAGHTTGLSGTRTITISDVRDDAVKMSLSCFEAQSDYKWYPVKNGAVVFDIGDDELGVGSLAHDADTERLMITPSGDDILLTLYFRGRSDNSVWSGSQVFEALSKSDENTFFKKKAVDTAKNYARSNLIIYQEASDIGMIDYYVIEFNDYYYVRMNFNMAKDYSHSIQGGMCLYKVYKDTWRCTELFVGGDYYGVYVDGYSINQLIESDKWESI